MNERNLVAQSILIERIDGYLTLTITWHPDHRPYNCDGPPFVSIADRLGPDEAMWTVAQVLCGVEARYAKPLPVKASEALVALGRTT